MHPLRLKSHRRTCESTEPDAKYSECVWNSEQLTFDLWPTRLQITKNWIDEENKRETTDDDDFLRLFDSRSQTLIEPENEPDAILSSFVENDNEWTGDVWPLRLLKLKSI